VYNVGINKKKYQFDDLLALMPDAWKEKAREFKAFTRTRKLKTVVDLMQLVFLLRLRRFNIVPLGALPFMQRLEHGVVNRHCNNFRTRSSLVEPATLT
jgi:hypothetical protein